MAQVIFTKTLFIYFIFINKMFFSKYNTYIVEPNVHVLIGRVSIKIKT